MLTYVCFTSESGHQLSALGMSVKGQTETHALQQLMPGFRMGIA